MDSKKTFYPGIEKMDQILRNPTIAAMVEAAMKSAENSEEPQAQEPQKPNPQTREPRPISLWTGEEVEPDQS